MINEARLVQTMLDLIAIDSPSGQEAAVGADLMERLAALAGDVVRDEHGNIIAHWPQGEGEWLLLSAHMDTVGQDTGIRPVVRDGVIYSDGTTILGADDKSGIAVILEVVRCLIENDLRHPPLEVVITVSEEVGLDGARDLDKSKLHARSGYVLDSGGPIGTVIVSAPSQDSLEVTVHGKTAHAGSEPEKGINAIQAASAAIVAMPLGRIDAETTANIGAIAGGVATNIVPERVQVRGEARSRDLAKLEAQTAAMVQAFQDAAARYGARADVQVRRVYTGYKLTPETPAVKRVLTALEKLEMEPILKGTGGGSDANIFHAHGITTVVLSTGMADVHTPQEHIAIADLVDSARLLFEIVTAA